LEDKPLDVCLQAAARAKAAHTFEKPTPGRVDGGNPERLNPRPENSLKEKEQKDKDKREKRDKDKACHNKKPEHEVED
jgi:hypothetical protein